MLMYPAFCRDRYSMAKCVLRALLINIQILSIHKISKIIRYTKDSEVLVFCQDSLSTCCCNP